MKTICVVVCMLLLTAPVRAQPSQPSQLMQEFRRLEWDTWREYRSTAFTLLADSTFDVQFYHLSLDLGLVAPSIRGNVLCRFSILENNIASIRFNLRREFMIDSIRGDATSFTFTQDTIVVSLDHPFQAGESGSVRIYYRGVPPVANGTKGLRYVTHAGNQRVIASLSTPFLSHYWWPCKDGPGDKPDSVYIDITIPDTTLAGLPVVAVSNGVLSNVISAGGKRTFQWREHFPVAPYYVMAAVSNYRDFHQMFTGGHNEQFPMDYFVFSEHLSAAQAGVADLPQVMALFSERFGVYPFATEKYGMTQLGFYGAIENQTNTIINAMGVSSFGVAVHELSHMWFGDMITCRDWHHGWLNEGFATYAEALWTEHIAGLEAYKSYMQNFQYLGNGTLYLQDISDPFNIFIPIIYDKGAYVLHMLRGVLGDSLFFASLSAYTGDAGLRYGHATTEDFQSVCEAISQRDLGFFFDQWVYDQYYPTYTYGFARINETGETSVHVRQTQSSLGRRAVFEMPVRLKFLFEGGGDTTITVWNDRQVQTFDLVIPQPISSMQFDPDMWILRTAQPVSVNEGNPPSGGFALEQNYPNPFNPATTIRFHVPRGGWVELTVYDLLGRRVATPVHQAMPAGAHEVTLDAGRLAAGVYFYRLRSGPFIQTRKLTIVK